MTTEFIESAGFVDSASAPQTLTVPGDIDPSTGGGIGSPSSFFGS